MTLMDVCLSWCPCPSGPWGSGASQRHTEVCCKELAADGGGGWGHQADPEWSGLLPGGWLLSKTALLSSCRARGARTPCPGSHQSLNFGLLLHLHGLRTSRHHARFLFARRTALCLVDSTAPLTLDPKQQDDWEAP